MNTLLKLNPEVEKQTEWVSTEIDTTHALKADCCSQTILAEIAEECTLLVGQFKITGFSEVPLKKKLSLNKPFSVERFLKMALIYWKIVIVSLSFTGKQLYLFSGSPVSGKHCNSCQDGKGKRKDSELY